MRKLTSGILVMTFCFLAAVPALPQRMRESRDSERQLKLRTTFARVEAVSDGMAVLLEWETKAEIDNLGFNIYRVGQANPINSSLILGAAAKSNLAIQTGDSYRFLDVDGLHTDEYVVESVGANGRRSKSGVAKARAIESVSEDKRADFQSLRERALGVDSETGAVPASSAYKSIKEFVHLPDLENHRWVTRQPGVKIAVKKDGLYRVSCTQLANAGFNITSRANNWRLFRDGVEQAILIGTGAECIEFFGKGIDTPESDTRIYYLINNSVPGKRIRSQEPRVAVSKSLSANYPATLEKKERTFFVPSIINGDKDNYWGSIVLNDPTTRTFTLSAVDFSSLESEITVKIQGFRRIPGQTTNHVIAAKLNGNLLPNFSGANHEAFEGRFTVPTSFLTEGTNSLELRSVNPSDFSLFDSVSVNYARNYRADQNRLSVVTPAVQRAVLSGFSSADIRVFDISRDGQAILLSGLSVVPDSGTFSVNLPAGRSIAAFGIEKSGLLTPFSVGPNLPSDLANPANQADLVIIHYGHPEFFAAAETWATYRRGEGFAVKVADINDVFDEFNFGVTSSQAINNFLNHAYTNWQVKPRYALLLGDATNDPRNYLNYGDYNFIPSRAVSLIYGESGSDEALADFNNDGLAEIAIGRIPVRTAAAINIAFNKTVLFETQAEQDFDRGALFAFDVPDGWNFQLSSQQLSEELPPATPRLNVPRGMLAPGNPFTLDPNAQTNLLNGLNAGKYIVNYAGHGTSGLWASSGYFNNAAAGQITNAQHPTIFTMLTCLNGYFLRPDADSISEVLLKSTNGGAVAAWASTADTTPDIQTVMGIRFYDALAENDSDRLGDLIREAKTAIPAGTDVRLSWALLGDPMLKVNDIP